MYTMAAFEPPFYGENITSLFNAISYKNPKPIAQYSPNFCKFVNAMLNKKKEMRPLVTDLIDFFNEKHIASTLHLAELKLADLDKQNYKDFKSEQAKSFNKKRMIEKNTIGITNDFSALKNRIVAGNKSFRANFLNQAQFTVNFGSQTSQGSQIFGLDAMAQAGKPPL